MGVYGEEEKFAERVELLKPYQVNMKMIKATGNENVIFLHCLPFHDVETMYGDEVYEKYGLKEMEVTDEVFRNIQKYLIKLKIECIQLKRLWQLL